MQVYGTMTLAISIDVSEGTTEAADNAINSFNLNLLYLDLPTVANRIHKATVHDVNVEWESDDD